MPLVRRVNSLCSNCFIVAAPECVMVIDPGADEDQTSLIEDKVLEALAIRPRPVLITMTHCHRDHSLAAGRLSQRQPSWLVAVQESGAAAMRDGDHRLTMAYFFNEKFPPIKVDLDLLPAVESAVAGRQPVADGPDGPLYLETVIVDQGPGPARVRQSIGSPRGSFIEFYHAPGHSPDSMLIKIGGLLFLGDIFNATAPMVAGGAGFDRGLLLDSLALIDELLDSGAVGVCCAGHGQPMSLPQARELAGAVRREAAGMGELVPLDERRLAFLKQYAEAVLHELDQSFTVVAGRLFTLCFFLEQLEENQLAETILNSLDIDAIDHLIAKFHAAQRTQREVDMELRIPILGLIALKRINHILRRTKLLDYLDPLTLKRLRSLLLDYFDAARGAPFHLTFLTRDLNEFVADFTGGYDAMRQPDEALLASVEDQQAFSMALAKHIATSNALPPLRLDLALHPAPVMARIDHDRCTDLLVDFLERFHGAGAHSVEIKTDLLDGVQPIITLRPTPATGLLNIANRKKRLWALAAKIARCQLIVESDAASIAPLD